MLGGGSVTWFSNEITGVASTVVNEQLKFITTNTLNITLERSPLIGSNPSADHVMILVIIKQAISAKPVKAFFNGVEQITKADRLTRVTPFAENAKPAPRYGGLVPPFCDHKKRDGNS